MRRLSPAIAILLAIAVTGGAGLHAQDLGWQPPNWDRASALELARSPGSRALYVELVATRGRSPALPQAKLDALGGADELSWPEKEAALLRWLDSLADADRGDVPESAMAVLMNWQPRTLVEHEENPTVGHPLFDIAGRAWGIENRWRREEARAQGAKLLADDPHQFAGQYLAITDPRTGAGLLDALAMAGRDAQQQVLKAALSGGGGNEHTRTTLAVAAASALGDPAALQSLIERTSGPDLRPVLQTLAGQLDADMLYTQLRRIVDSAAPEHSALAIGVWSARLAGHAPSEALLLGLLDDRELGSSAALALTHAPSDAALSRLNSLAQSKKPGASRAQLALRIAAERRAQP